MSKLSNEIMMLRLLENGRKYSIDELSRILEVSPRMIRSYKNDLELAGFDIETIHGKYGGYMINNSIFKKNFCKDDIELLNNIKNILNDNDFRFMREYELLLSKIENSSITPKIKNGNITDIDDKNKYNIISNGIKNMLKIQIDYLSLDGNVVKRIIHPGQIFNCDNELYVAAFCELRGEIRHFAFSRIKNIKLLDANFL